MTITGSTTMASGSITTNGSNGTSHSFTDLPEKSSPTLVLLHPTEQEKITIWNKNGESWRGALSVEAYLRREHHLSDQELTKEGGISYWILVDSAAKDRIVLAACETYRKKALVARNREVEEVVSHGIGSVFSPPEFRGRGYASRMMKLLGEKLKTWQATDEEGCAFSILYSDIGKKFYAAHGWEPFNSAHISIPAMPTSNDTSGHEALPEARPIYAADLEHFCAIDVELIRDTLSTASSAGQVSVALIPDIATIRWHHAREQFVSQELRGQVPEVKGAIVGTEPGKRVWCYWTRMFYNKDPQSSEENTLHILRLVVEARETFTSGEASADQDESQYVPAITALFKMALREAAEWNMADVQAWNPTDATIRAVQNIQPSAKVIQRDTESIASLMWYGERTKEGTVTEYVDWLGNEKYGWC